METILTSYETPSSVGSGYDYENGGSNRNRGQSFEIQVNASVTKIGIQGSRGNGASGTTKIQLLSGSMTGTVLAEKTVTTTSAFPVFDGSSPYNVDWTYFIFDTPVNLVANTKYYIKMINTGSGNDEVRWVTKINNLTYSYGGAWVAGSGQDGGWVDYSSTRDKGFRVYGIESSGVTNYNASFLNLMRRV